MQERDVDLEKLFEQADNAALDTYLRLLHPADVALLFNYVSEDYWPRLASRLEPEVLAEVLAELDESQRAALGDVLHPERLISVFEELDSDDAADVIADLPEDKSEAVLDGLEDDESAAIRSLLAFAEDSAGGLMQTELCRVRDDQRVGDALDAIRAVREEVDDIHRIYLVDEMGRLTGWMRLEDVALNAPDNTLRDLREPIDYVVTPEVDQEEVARIFRMYDIAALPVVDEDGILLGRITFDDIHDVLEEEASEDILKMAGASVEELVYSGDFLRIAAFRLPWLVSSMLGSLVTGYLLTLLSVVPGNALLMASLVPVVMAMTGNVGSQTAMIVTRGFAIGRVEFATLGRTFVREVTVGVLIGIVAGLSVGSVARFWIGDFNLGVTVATAIMCSTSIAAFVGTLAPAVFKRIGVDPAIAAGPLVTTGCDLMGVSIYLGVAYLLLS